MEISRLHCIIVIVHCAVLFPCLVAKPFSLNEAIAAETAIASANKTAKNTETIAERISLNKAFTPSPQKYKGNKKNKKPTGLLKPQTKKLSPLKYRKLFQIDVPLKPKRLHIQKPILRRRNQALKRETSLNERFNQKYVPLLRNLGLFFNNLLSSTESEYYDDRDSSNREMYYTDGAEDIDCPCFHKSEPKQEKETAAFSPDPLTKISHLKQAKTKAATTTTDNITTRDVRRLRQNQNLPLLFARDPSSRESDHHGFSERGGAPLHRSTKRNITGYNGDSQHDTGRSGNNTDAAFHDETTPSAARDRASGSGTAGGGTGNGADTGDATDRAGINETDRTTETENATGEARGIVEAFEDEVQLEVSGNETKHPESFRGRLRRPVPEHQIGNIGESLQPGEDHEESFLNVGEHLTSNQSITEGDGAITPKDQTLRTADEAMILRSGPLLYKRGPNDRKVVMIFDGYSVARGKYGENKIAEKAIHVQQ